MEKKPSLVKKLSAKELFDSPSAIKKMMNDAGIKEKGQNFLLFTVGGIARGMISGESNFGQWVAFVGRFQAIIPGKENEPIRSNKFFPPVSLADELQAALEPNKTTGEIAEVQFLANIYVTPSEKTNQGYEYITEPLGKHNSGSDPLDEIFKALPNDQKKSLPAPKK